MNSSTPQLARTLRLSISLAALAGASLLPAKATADANHPTMRGVNLEESHCGTPCVMLFGRVGESFSFDLAPSGDAQVKAGTDATGRSSRLPQGLQLQQEEASLSGVPVAAGFHELVVVATVDGKSSERVLLIDIQPAPRIAAAAHSHANYFTAGVH